MKDIWAAKAQSDGEIGHKQLMAEFLYDFFMVCSTSLNAFYINCS